MKCEHVIRRLASCVVYKLSLKTFFKEAEKGMWTGAPSLIALGCGFRPGNTILFLLSHPHAFYCLVLPVMLATASRSVGSAPRADLKWNPAGFPPACLSCGALRVLIFKLTVPLDSCFSASSHREWVSNFFICFSCTDLIM